MGEEREQARDESRAKDLFHKAKGVASYWTRKIDVFKSSCKRMRDLPEPLGAAFDDAYISSIINEQGEL